MSAQNIEHTQLRGQFKGSLDTVGADSIPSCVGPIPPVVITKSYFCTIRLLASMLRCCYFSKQERRGSADVHFVLFVRYHLNALPAMPSSIRKGITIITYNSMPFSKQ